MTPLSLTIARLQVALTAQTRRVLAEHGSLTLPEWRVLRVVGAGIATRSTAVRHEAFIDKGQFSRTLDALREHDLVVLRQAPDDHRQSEIRLTRRGRAAYARIAPALDDRHARFFGVLNEREHATFVRSLERVLDALEARGGDD